MKNAGLESMKQEVASELGVPLKQGYNGDLTAKQVGSVGGEMVKRMIKAQEAQMGGK
ncbi:MAG: alpha/beta-type small acid-soluble spore protein [Cellulosilyticaceae bacterium]